MSIIKTKGTVFSVGVGGSSVALSQVISLELPEPTVEFFEADTLDNMDVGIPKKSTGRVDGGQGSADMFLDTSTHTAITTFLTSPPDPDDDPQGSGSIAFGGGGGMSFEVCSMSLGGSVALNDGLKGKATFVLDGAPTWS